MRMAPEEDGGNSKPNHHKTPPAPATQQQQQVKKRRPSWSDGQLWLNKGDAQQALRNVVTKLRLQSLSNSTTPPSEPDSDFQTLEDPDPNRPCSDPDYTYLLSDELLLKVLSRLPESQHISNSLVCKRWCKLSGKLVQSIKLLDWEFLESGRLVFRFPNLIDIDILRACVKLGRNSGILISHRLVSVHLDSSSANGGFVRREDILNWEVVDGGVKILVEGCANIRRMVLINTSEESLKCVADKCETLQELELHCCDDFSLRGISGCKNLQILKLVGSLDGFYSSMVSDIGLTIVAQGCRRLLKLELVGCEGSYDGIKAIGQCCLMLEELTLYDHRMDDGWLSALSYCSNLKTLKLQSCKNLDLSPGPDEHLGSCPSLEELHLQRCQLRDKQGLRALFLVCMSVRELVIEDCWGLDNNAFASACILRGLRVLSLHGCSLLTTEGLDSVIESWRELQRLRVVSCKNIKDSEITPALAMLFSTLKELKWRPDSRSLLSSSLEGTGIGQKGGRSFRWK
nr:F-box protein At5g51380-like [Ipomoea batatas]